MSEFQCRTPAQSLWRILLLGFVFLTLQACSKADDADKKPEGTPVSISGYNYTIEGIQEFYVNGAWGGNLGIGDGGGSIVCCVMLPDKWTPGLSATVEWRRSDCQGNGPGNERCPFGTHGEGWHEKTLKSTVPVEPYDRPNTLQVMFLPNDEVKIYSSMYDAGHTSHPSKLGRPYPIGHPEHPAYKPNHYQWTSANGKKDKP